MTELGEFQVGDHAEKDHRAHHREVERRRDAEQVDEVLEFLKQHDAQHHADDRAFTAAQREAAEHRGGNGVELIEVCVRRWRNRARVHGEIDRGEHRHYLTDDIGGDNHQACPNAGIARGFLVLAHRVEVAAEDRAMQHDPHDRRHDGLIGTFSH